MGTIVGIFSGAPVRRRLDGAASLCGKLVKRVNEGLSGQTTETAGEIKSGKCPFYPLRFAILEVEGKFKERGLRAALFVFLG